MVEAASSCSAGHSHVGLGEFILNLQHGADLLVETRKKLQVIKPDF